MLCDESEEDREGEGDRAASTSTSSGLGLIKICLGRQLPNFPNQETQLFPLNNNFAKPNTPTHSKMPPRLPTLLILQPPRTLLRAYSTATKLTLAYDLHKPAKPVSNAPGAIIFMHGLFGSKKNNRSISK